MKKRWLLALALLVSLVSAKSPNEQEGVTYLNSRNEDGSVKTLEQVIQSHKGKVIYIDFWASWCGPCRRQMPFSKKLHQKFEGEDIVFLYIALNDRENAWRKAINGVGVKGLHFLPEAEEAKRIGSQFNIYGIPHYALVDKNGKIVMNNAARPSSPKAAKQIESLL